MHTHMCILYYTVFYLYIYICIYIYIYSHCLLGSKPLLACKDLIHLFGLDPMSDRPKFAAKDPNDLYRNPLDCLG